MAEETRTTSSTGGQKAMKLARFDLIPIGPLTALAEHYGRGALKYADNQWRKGYEWSKSYAAMQRHTTAFWGGEDFDLCPPDSSGCAFVTEGGEPFVTLEPRTCHNHTGSHHMAAAAWHAFLLLDFSENHPGHDDRYKAGPGRELTYPSPDSLRDIVRRMAWSTPETIEASAGESPLHDNRPRSTFHLAELEGDDAEVIYRAHLGDIRAACKDSHPI